MESQRTMGASVGPNSSDTLHIQLVIYKRWRARKSCRISAWGSDTIGRNRLRSDGKGEREVSGQTDGLVRFHGSHGHILTEKRENHGHEKRNVPSFNRTLTIHGTGGASNGGGLKVTYEETWKLATATVTRECLGGRSRKKLRAPQKPEIRIHTVIDLILSGNQS